MADGEEGGFAGAETITLQEGAGPVRVTVDGGVATLTAPQRPELAPAPIDAAGAAVMLGLDEGDVIAPPVLASAGNGFLVVELASNEVLGRVVYDRAAWLDRGAGDPDLGAAFLIVVDPGASEVRARMLGPGFGIEEDPATGSAAAAVAARSWAVAPRTGATAGRSTKASRWVARAGSSSRSTWWAAPWSPPAWVGPPS